jgi:hypothetical protein
MKSLLAVSKPEMFIDVITKPRPLVLPLVSPVTFMYLRPLSLNLSNPIFLPTAYSPALICFGR